MPNWIGESVEVHYGHLHQYRFAKRFVKLKKVLDLACGEGYGGFMLSEEADSVIGIDIDEETVRHASSEYISENLSFIKGSITDIPIDGERIFDVIVCFKVPDHIEERHELLKEVKRLLKTDGIFIVSTFNKSVDMDQPNDQNLFHLKELYFDEFKDLLSKNFKSVLFYGQKVYPSSNIFPLYKESGSTKDFSIEKGDEEFLFVSPGRKLATYFMIAIAAASESNVDKNLVLGNSYQLDFSETLIQQKDAQISSLERLVRDKDAALNGIYASYGWKALLTFYRLIEKIFPMNTKRRLIAKVIFKILTELRTVFKYINITNLKNFFASRQAIIIEKCRVCGAQINFTSNYPIDNLRGTIICYSCNSLKRNIDLAESILRTYKIPLSSSLADSLNRFANLSIYEVGYTGSIHELFSCLPYFTSSESSADVKLGSVLLSGATCKDVQSLTFKDNSFDLVISQEVFEHVAQPELAFKEIYRILKPGGYHIFTVPYYKGTHKSLTRAVLQDGEIKHLLSPVYHADTSGHLRALVFTDFGEDLIDLLQSIGFQVDLDEKNNVNYKNGPTVVFITEKNGCGIERSIPAGELITEMGSERPYHENVRLIAFYLPQFHPIPENDKWWGKGFTEWTKVVSARPLFLNHYQPHIPADLGFYDLRLPEARQSQVDLATAYGIYGFCYYHYWFKGKQLLEHPFERVLATNKPDFPFCLCWANENWTRAWDGQSGEVLIRQDYSEEDDLEHIRYLCQAFEDRRYIRINGKPLFLVYCASKIPNPLKTTEIWREEAEKLGLGELYLCRVESFPDEHSNPIMMGFDASVEFQPDWTNLGPKLPEYENLGLAVYQYRDIVERMLKKDIPGYKRFPCITPSWDNSPRRKQGAVILLNSTPQLYERWLWLTISKLKSGNKEENIIFINAMNEWGEGCHLEPDLKNGKAYLEATQRVLSKLHIRYPIDQYKDKSVGVQESGEYKKLSFRLTEQPLISIVISVHNQWEFTYPCLLSIIKNSGDILYEIILADDASTDETVNAPNYIENIKVIRNLERLGFLRNTNNASEHALGKYILFLNNDTLVQKDWLKYLIDLIEKDNRIGLLGSKLLFSNKRLQAAGGIILKDGSARHYGRGDDPKLPEYNYVKEVDYISGACLMMRNDLWKKIGRFDTRFSPAYYEDVDLAFEVRKQGYKVVYQPQSVVVHFESVSYGSGLDQGRERHQMINQKKFTEKWRDILKFKQMPHSHEIFHGRDRSRGKKTILVVDHSVPDFDKYAGSRTSFHYLKIFLELGLNVKFIDDNYIKYGSKYEPYTTLLEQIGIEVLSHDWYRKNWRQWVKNHARSIDYVYLNRPISIDYIDALKRETKAKIIYNCIDFHYLREIRQYKATKDKTFLKLSKEHKKQEFYLFKNSDILFTYSDYEKSILKKRFSKKIVQVIPLFIYDKDFPLGIAMDFETRTGLTFVGGFGHLPNVDGIMWFVNEIFPKILKKNNEIELSIIGSNMPEEILKLRSKCINVIGYVSEEKLQEYYSKTRIAVVPLRFGAGVKGKVIEAIAYGVPVVTTEVGREGITGLDGIVRIADQPEGFAESVMDIYMDKQKWTDMRNKQVEYANQYFSLDYSKNLIRGILKI